MLLSYSFHFLIDFGFRTWFLIHFEWRGNRSAPFCSITLCWTPFWIFHQMDTFVGFPTSSRGFIFWKSVSVPQFPKLFNCFSQEGVDGCFKKRRNLHYFSPIALTPTMLTHKILFVFLSLQIFPFLAKFDRYFCNTFHGKAGKFSKMINPIKIFHCWKLKTVDIIIFYIYYIVERLILNILFDFVLF